MFLEPKSLLGYRSLTAYLSPEPEYQEKSLLSNKRLSEWENNNEKKRIYCWYINDISLFFPKGCLNNTV